jgi:pre-mRNA-splicing factor SYF1
MWNWLTIKASKGTLGKVRYLLNSVDVSCPCQERGIVAALMRNNVLANFCGHDHDNDFSGIYSRNGYTIELTYGRKTGYGYYGPPPDMLHGGRVITLTRLTNVH